MVIKAAELHKSGVCQNHYSEFPMCKSVCGQGTGMCNYLLIVGTFMRRNKTATLQNMYLFLFLK